MNILVSSYAFYPSVGGIEEVTDLLAREFSKRGHAVKILTMTRSTEPDSFPFEVVRRPSMRRLTGAIRWCDVYLQQQISLRFAWPLLFIRRPWIVAQHAPLDGSSRLAGVKRLAKRACIDFADQIMACSQALAAEFGSRVTVVPNPYRETLFRSLPGTTRSCDLVFLGRLVSDKGVALLLDALALLRARGATPSLMIIGQGPEEASLRAQSKAHALTDQVRFVGVARGERLVELLNQCRIIAIPSTWEEPFGVVALEAIACGCVVAAARAGGLPEAIGTCGVTFAKGDANALAECLADLLDNGKKIADLRAGAPAHLARHRPGAVAEAYLDLLRRAYGGNNCRAASDIPT